ncbi:HIT family protein [Oceanivirga salmonicida]|uniref:HIT family protein n=1 Tax=Oceanivirga salmonicida TaxID=1769291 RepID=UPI00083330FE|nr:HIT family protein [Oceanivirga salmonicida]
MNDCIFCKIINNELPLYKIYEDEYTYAFLDISEDIDGHTLVIPKKHYENVLDCDNIYLRYLIETVSLVSKHYVKNCNYDGVNILNASGKAAQQSVNHFHIHIIPRLKNDEENVWPKLSGSKNKIEYMYEKLRIGEE